MSLTDILNVQSSWTYEIMAKSAQTGEMIREDAITSVNLAEINYAATQEQIKLSILSNQGARLERETGADWQWIIEGAQAGWLVQAKRFDAVGFAQDAVCKIDLEQMDLLLGYAKTLSSNTQVNFVPAYVFYISPLVLPRANGRNVGCMFIPAEQLYASRISGNINRGQREFTLHFQAVLGDLRPWREMFSS